MSINRLARRRPTPALILACIALFVALGGTSYAVATGSIGSPQIRDGSIRSIDVKDGGLRGRDLAPDSLGGDAIAEETLDVSKLGGGASFPLRAQISHDGRLVRGRGVIDVVHVRAGIYEVVFERDLSECFPLAMPGSQLAYGPDIAGAAEIRVGVEGATVHLATGDSAGALVDHDFYLLVAC